MRIHSILAKNYRPFAVLEEVRLGPLATIAGQNDAGKSNILRALQLFFEAGPKIEGGDVHDGASPDDDVVVEVAFASLPEKIELQLSRFKPAFGEDLSHIFRRGFFHGLDSFPLRDFCRGCVFLAIAFACGFSRSFQRNRGQQSAAFFCPLSFCVRFLFAARIFFGFRH